MDPDKIRPTSVFVSYSRADQKRATPVIAALEKAGCQVWWDGLLEGGDTYLPTTEAALEGADAVVVLWSRTSVDSHWVRDEATRGRDRRCLVPLSLDGAEPPLGFRQFQVIDCSKWRGKADAPEMQRALRAVLALGGRQTMPPPSSAPKASRRGVMMGAGSAALLGAAGWMVWKGGLPGTSAATENSIAVVPFENLSGDPEQAYFSDGLSEELRSTLSRNKSLRVAAPASSTGLRDQPIDALTIARKLAVAYVLRGSVRRQGDVVRIVAELINGKDAVVRWSQSFDRPLHDIFALQSEISNIVAVALVEEVSGKDAAVASARDQREIGGTRNVAAYDAYLRGRALFDLGAGEETNRAALTQMDAAIAADFRFSAAHAMRSTLLSAIAAETSAVSEVGKLFEQAIAAAQKAITLAPDLAQAHVALGYALNNGRFDAKNARIHYDRARILAPGDADILRAFAAFSAVAGRPREADDAMRRALVLDPLNARAFRSAGLIAYVARDFPATIARTQYALSLNPKLGSAYAQIGNALYLQGKLPEARTAYLAEPVKLFSLTGLAIALQRHGEGAAAQSAFAKLIADYGNNSLYQQAEVLAQWGKTDEAMTRLAQAQKFKDAGLLLTPTDPLLDPLRNTPRFNDLLSFLGSR